MIEIVIRGNRVDTDKDTRLCLKYTGGIFRIVDNEFTRSYGLSVPVTDGNNKLFNHDGDPVMDGVRTASECYIMSGGVIMPGDIYLQSYSGRRYELLFVERRGSALINQPLNLVSFQDTITVSQKDVPSETTVPDFGWYWYHNEASQHGVVGNPNMYPVTNLGYLIQKAAVAAGYAVQYLNGGSIYEDASNYGIILPTMNTYSSATVTVNGSGHGGWSTVVSGGQSLADIGLSIVARRFKRGLVNANITVYTFTALRHIRVRCDNSLLRVFMNGQGKREDWLNWPEYQAIDMELNAGEYFTIVSASDIYEGLFTDYVYLIDGYTTNIPTTKLEVLDDDGIAGENETIYLRNNLPDMTLADLLTAYCNLTCSSWTVDDESGRIIVETFAHALGGAGTSKIDLDAARVVSVESVERFLDGFARHNRVVCKPASYVTDEYKFMRDYPCTNDILEEEAEFAVIPFNEGNYEIDGNGDLIAHFDDVTIGSNMEYQYKGVLSMFFAHLSGGAALHLQTINEVGGMGAEFAAFTNQATTVKVTVLLPLLEFAQFTPSTVCTWRGRDYIIRTGIWSDGKCVLELVRLEI